MAPRRQLPFLFVLLSAAPPGAGAQGISKEQALKAAKTELAALKANADELEWVQKQTYADLLGMSFAAWKERAPKMIKVHEELAREVGVEAEHLVPHIWGHVADPEVLALVRERQALTAKITEEQVVDLAKAEVAALRADPEGLAWMKQRTAAELGAMQFKDYQVKVPYLAKALGQKADELGFTAEDLMNRKTNWYQLWMTAPNLAPVLGQMWDLYKALSAGDAAALVRDEIKMWEANPAELAWYKARTYAQRADLFSTGSADIPAAKKFADEQQKKHGVPFEKLIFAIMTYVADPEVYKALRARARLTGIPADTPEAEKRFLTAGPEGEL
mmetsp:Transcript_35508/g.99752  ORF Transcript_35508/g.99752 Transcript_35508/m.99752 type:complete len:331 (+) Transcript_35508:67-1059(+)